MKFRPPHFSQSAFTLVEVAISLAIIGIALVAIIGVLPLGMNVQRDNREGTIINQDASVFIEAIRNGSRGLDDLTNYVYAITNYQTLYDANGNPGTTVAYGYVYSSNSWLTNGANILGLLGTPEYTGASSAGDAPSQPIPSLIFGGYSNHILATVRSISGPAVEKPPQDNDIIQADSFGYRLYCVNAPVAMDTNILSLATNNFSRVYGNQLSENLHELRLTFLWPVQPNGRIGNGRQTYRALIGGQIAQTNYSGQMLYFYQPQNFTNAP